MNFLITINGTTIMSILISLVMFGLISYMAIKQKLMTKSVLFAYLGAFIAPPLFFTFALH